MNGYSKMRVSSSSHKTNAARSIDFSDPTSFAYASPDHTQEHPNPTPKAEENNNNNGGGGGERSGVALRRNFSSASQRFRASDYKASSSSSSSSSFGAVVRRAFSMRKAASVAEGYWRIDGNGEDVDGEVMEGEEEEEEEEEQQVKMRSQRNKKKKKKKGRIFKAWKKLFGF